MRTNVPEKLIRLSSDIESKGHQSLTRLTVLKKWFSNPNNLKSFSLFIAKRAASRKGKSQGDEALLFKRSSELLKTIDIYTPDVPTERANELVKDLSSYQNTIEKHKWNDVRVIKNRNLYLVEEGVRFFLFYSNNPSLGYKLAVSYSEI